MTEKSVSELVEKEKTEIFVRFKVENRFFGAKEEFAARLKGEVRIT